MVNKDIFKKTFDGTQAPPWPCPSCGNGMLKLVSGTFQKQETAESRRLRLESGHEPEWIEYVYACLLQCANDSCGEFVANAGSGAVVSTQGYDVDDEVVEEYRDNFSPKYFHPHLKLIRIPSTCSENVKASINKSFELLFASPSASMNSLRSALESILTDMGVETSTNSSRLNLHQRIEKIPNEHDSIKQILLAVKWLGNNASHPNSDLVMKDLFEAFELFERILEEIYEQKTNRLNETAERIKLKKGASNYA
jgi:hypothetical protein